MLLGSHYTAKVPFLLDGNLMEHCCQPYANKRYVYYLGGGG